MINKNFSNFELCQLKEIINIGASHASTALSQLIEKRIMLTIPEALADISKDNIIQVRGTILENEATTAVILKIFGDISGVMAFFSPKNSAHRLVHLAMKSDGGIDEVLSELENSALKEIGNIICGAALGAFSKFMGVTMLQSMSEMVVDRFDTIVSNIIMEVSQDSVSTLVFKVSFKIEGEDVDSQLCLFVDNQSSNKMISILKKQLNIA